MSYPIKYPTPQGANIQIFNAGGTIEQTWVKPQGASFVWFTLIGAGGGGHDVIGGGGSGAVTNCMVPAFLIPDSLIINVGAGGITLTDGQITTVNYKTGSTTTSYNLLSANPGLAPTSVPGVGGAASTSNYFSCMGFFQSIAGQNGFSSSGSASATTFLSGGAVGSNTANYGYTTASNGDGFFQIQPIIVGVGGGTTANNNGRAGIGCGGSIGLTDGGSGGNGLVVIITW